MEEGFDTEATTETVDTTQALQDDTADSAAQDGTGAKIQPDSETTDPSLEASKPFASGKEKFKVDGKEAEWDWETTKRYAQIGATGYQRMQKAAEVQKSAERAYEQLISAADKDPIGLLRTLNPNFKPETLLAMLSGNAPKGQSKEVQEPSEDPRYQTLEQKLNQIEQSMEQAKIAEVRAEIDSELGDAVKKFPELDSNIYRKLVKSEYRAALNKGLEVSIEDVAFILNQELQNDKMSREKARAARLQENRDKAPVRGGAAPSVGGSKPMSLEDVKRLAGRM